MHHPLNASHYIKDRFTPQELNVLPFGKSERHISTTKEWKKIGITKMDKNNKPWEFLLTPGEKNR